MTGGEMGVIAAQALAAGGTFTLAFFAFKAIRQTRETQRQLRKVGQLREVAEWAVDVMKVPRKLDVPLIPPETSWLKESDGQAYLRWITVAYHINIALELDFVRIRGTYIQSVAQGLDKELHSKVVDTIDCIRILENDISQGKYLEMKRELLQPLDDSTKQVIERALELIASL